MKIRKRGDAKPIIIFISFLLSMSLGLVTVITFMIAFFNGYETPFVFINNYGEAIPEFVMLIIIMIVICYGLYLSGKDIKIKKLRD